MNARKLMTAFLGVTMAAMLLAGCVRAEAESDNRTGETGKNETAAPAGGSDTEYPLTIRHAYGETVLNKKPERIAAIQWGNQDTPLALGIAPVGVSAANYGKVTENTLHVWTDEAFKELGVDKPTVFDDLDGLDYEGISDTNPDVILASYSGITQEEYDLLSEIAPVVAYPTVAFQTDWQEQTILNAAGMGMKAEGEAKVKEVEELIAEKTSEYPDLKGTRTAFFWISPDDFSTFYVYMPADPRAGFLTDLGLTFPDSVEKLARRAEDFSVTLSRENAEQLRDVDMMVVYGDEKLLEALQADQLMSEIPAIRNGAVVLLDSTSALAAATTPSVLSIPASIDEYLGLLSEARGKVK